MKKIGKILTGMMLCAVMIFGNALPVAAADGVLELSVSSETLTQGEDLTVTVSAKTSDGKEAVSVMRVTYDASVFSFTGCSETCGAGSGLVSVTTNEATITLRAIGSGESEIAVTGEDGVAYESAEELTKMTGAKKTVTVNPPATRSAGTDLSSLAVSEGTLTPAFTPATREYATVVPYETTSIAVNAKPAESGATVQSLSGNSQLSVGDNPVTVTVRADSGATETYTIHVVRAEEGQSVQDAQSIATAALSGQEGAEEAASSQQISENPEEVTLDGVLYRIADTFPSAFAEPDFVSDTLSFQGGSFPAYRFEKNSDIYLVSLQAEDGTEGIYVYDRITGQFSPYVKLQNGDRYIIVLAPPAAAELPSGYVSLTLDLNGQGGVTAYQKLSDGTQPDNVPDVTDEEEFDPSAVGMLFEDLFGPTEVYAADMSDFYLMYAVNSDGKEDWYQYDLGEETYQRYSGVSDELVLAESPQDPAVSGGNGTELQALQEEFAQFRKLVLYILIGIAAGFAVLLILLIVLGVQLRKAKEEIGAHPEDDEEDKSLWEELEDPEGKEEDREITAGKEADGVPYEDAYEEKDEDAYDDLYEDAYEDAYEESGEDMEEDVPEEAAGNAASMAAGVTAAAMAEKPEEAGPDGESEEAAFADEPKEAGFAEEPGEESSTKKSLEEALREESFTEEPEEAAFADEPEEAAFMDEPEEAPAEKPKKKKKHRFGKKDEEEKSLWEELADELSDEDETPGHAAGMAAGVMAGAIAGEPEEESFADEPEEIPAEEEPAERIPAEKHEKPKKRARKPKKGEKADGDQDTDDDLEVLDLNDL